MKKVILFFIVSIFLFICVYSYTSCVTHFRVEKSIEVCKTIIESIQLGENKVDKSIDGYEKVDEVIKELKGRDELPINLTEYFSEIINIDGFIEEVKRDKSDVTEEELEKIYSQVFGNNTSFVEEEAIFLDNIGSKCIKLKDLRRLDNGDGVVKYFDGEYIIDNAFLPLQYEEIKKIVCNPIIDVEENHFIYKYGYIYIDFDIENIEIKEVKYCE